MSETFVKVCVDVVGKVAVFLLEGDLFLCGMSPEELSEKLGVNIEFVSNDGSEFCLKMLAID